jgi:hypothetical protein
MRRTLSLLALLAALALSAGSSATLADTSSSGFFNGKDLDGWEGLKEYWSVKDGAIVGYTSRDPGFNTFLCSKKKYRDFELKFKIRLKDGKGNSGVQIRSKLVNRERFTVHGPQADIGAGYWGSLYGEGFGGMMKAASRESQKAVKAGDFNDYHIRCVGQHVTIKINGVTTVDQDFDSAWAKKGKGRRPVPDEGIIAFQLHAGYPSMEVTYKDIVFKEIKGGTAAKE